MKRIAIVFGTLEGQTARIADAIARELGEAGYSTHLVPASEGEWTFDSRGYAGLVLGAPVHYSKFPKAFRGNVMMNANELRKIPIAFFSVCLGVLEKDNPDTQEAERAIVRDLLEPFGLKPVIRAIFAGAIRYSKYGVLKKAVLRSIAKRAGVETRTDRDYEFTDWNEVREFTRNFVAILENRAGNPVAFPTAFVDPTARPSSSEEDECCS